VSQALYRFFDAGGRLLYIGISLNPGVRWKQHRADKPWWTEVATVTVEAHPDRTAVQAAEREAIRAERPRYNVAHNQTPEGGARLASMLTGMAEPPARFRDACPGCGDARLPDELYADEAGWVAVYDCCENWTREVAA